MSNISRRRLNQLMGFGGLFALSAPSVLADIASGKADAGFPLYDIAFSNWCFHLPLLAR